jgi:hypothetical protein
MEARVGIGRYFRCRTGLKSRVFLGIQVGFALIHYYPVTTLSLLSLALSLAVQIVVGLQFVETPSWTIPVRLVVGRIDKQKGYSFSRSLTSLVIFRKERDGDLVGNVPVLPAKEEVKKWILLGMSISA